MFCSHERLFKRALNQDRAVKRAYTVLHLSRNPDQCVFRVNGAILKQVEKFKYLEFALTSDKRQAEELDNRIGKASAVMSAFALFGCHATRIVEKGKALSFEKSFCPQSHLWS